MGRLNFKTEELNAILKKAEAIPEWATRSEKPAYTADEVGALPDNTEVLADAPEDGKTYGRKNHLWVEVGAASGGGGTVGGVSDYDDLDNKPSINGVTLTGDMTLKKLGIQAKGEYALKDEIPAVPVLEAPLNGQTYGRKNGSWVVTSEGGGTGEVQTGNVTSHTHDDDVIVSPMETDVWDGVTVSSSLSGTGTKDDPYLIRSCADFIYFNLHIGTFNAADLEGSDPTSATEWSVNVRIDKNLDFAGHNVSFSGEKIVDGETVIKQVLAFADINGQGCIISNFVSDNSASVFDALMYSYVHDVHVRNAQFTYDITGRNPDNELVAVSPVLGRYVPMYSFALNCSCVSTTTIKGTMDDGGTSPFILIYVGMAMIDSLLGLKCEGTWYGRNSFVSEVDTSSRALIVNYAPLYIGVEETTVIAYECSPSEDLKEDPATGFHVLLGDMGSPVTMYYNSDISSPFSGSGSSVWQAKTTAEMKSPEFLALLNSSGLNFVADGENVNDGYPLSAPAGIPYDGYVHTSVFNKKLAELNYKIVFDSLFLTTIRKSDRVKQELDKYGGFDALYDWLAAYGELYIKEDAGETTVIYRSQTSILSDTTERKAIFVMVVSPMNSVAFAFIHNKLTDTYYTSTNRSAGDMNNLTVSSESVDGKVQVNGSSLAPGQSIHVGVDEPVRLSRTDSTVKFVINGVAFAVYEIYIVISSSGNGIISVTENNGTYEVTLSSNISRIIMNDY